MSSPPSKKPRLQEAEVPHQWAGLEPGIWEAIFQGLLPEDKRQVRLVCKLFRDSSSRTIHHLNLDRGTESWGRPLRLAVSSLLLCRTGIFIVCWYLTDTDHLRQPLRICQIASTLR